MKMHDRITADRVVERYVRRLLDGEERREFEEHLLECSECFEETQITERFIAGIHEASRQGLLDRPRLTRWTFWLATAAALASAALIVTLFRISSLNHALDRSLSAQALLREKLDLSARETSRATVLPLAILQATRASQSESVVAVPAGVPQVALWIEVESGSRYRTFRVEVVNQQDQPIETLAGLNRNPDGALAIALPASKLKPGLYYVTLFAEEPRRLLARFALRTTGE